MATIKNYAGLEYAFLNTKKSSISIKDALVIDLKIAKEIIKHKPLRGKELHFLRKQIKASCAKMSRMTNGAFDASTISKWEKKSENRLSPSSEMYLRIFFAEQLDVNVKAKSKNLIPKDDQEIIEFAD